MTVRSRVPLPLRTTLAFPPLESSRKKIVPPRRRSFRLSRLEWRYRSRGVDKFNVAAGCAVNGAGIDREVRAPAVDASKKRTPPPDAELAAPPFRKKVAVPAVEVLKNEVVPPKELLTAAPLSV